MSGLEVLSKLQPMGLPQTLSIVLLSGMSDLKIENEGYRRGASTFLIKPLTPENFIALVGSLRQLVLSKQSDHYALKLAANSNTQ